MDGLDKSRTQDARGESEHADADDGDDAGEGSSDACDRGDVAVSDGSERGDGPPHGVRDAGEGFRLRFVFAVVEDARRDDEQQSHHGGGEDEFFFVCVQHVLDEAERCEVAPRLGDPQDAEEAQHAHGAKVDTPEGEVEGEDCEQVDDGHGA